MPIIPKTVSVVFEGGRTEEMTINEIKLKDYPLALKCVADEFSLVALATGRQRTVILDLTPASYEAVAAAVWSVNEAGFFSYAQRQEKRGVDLISKLSPDRLGEMLALSQSTPTPSGLPPRRS